MLKWWLSASLILLVVCLGSVVARADADYTKALQKVPQGIRLNRPDPFVTTKTTSKSSAAVVDGTNPQSPGTEAAKLTTGPNQFGTLWSTTVGALNLTQNQTLRMWLYLGDQDAQAGEGLAFVLQNDEAKLAAMPGGVVSGQIPGETLGVWAKDTDATEASAVNLAKSAIQNSWALEFDTYFNDQPDNRPAGKANAFDTNYPAVHIASNYPAQPTTYVQHFLPATNFFGALLGQKDYFYSMTHNGLIANVNEPDFLSNGQWHHLTLKWAAKTETMTYTFDDRDPLTNERQPGVSQSARIMPSKIDPGKTGTVRWGFTSASSRHFENNLVVLENIPSLIDATSQATLTNLTRQRVIQAGDQVLSNDRLSLEYQLTYHGGNQPWSNVRTDLKIPEKVDVTGGQIIYADGTAQPLDLAVIQAGRLPVQLTKQLNAANPTATIRLTGHAANATQTHKVPATTSTFTSPDLVIAADTPDFIINPRTDLELRVTSENPVALKVGQDTTVRGHVAILTSEAQQPGVVVTPVLNGQTLKEQVVGQDGTFQVPLTAAQLQGGTNRLKLVARTEQGDASRPVTLVLTVAGNLTFASISPSESFQAARLTGRAQRVKRAGEWRLAVRDTRGTSERWTLSAQASTFTAQDGRAMAGYPVYVTPYQTIRLGPTPTPVLSHVTDDSVNDGLVDVAGSWTSQTGVFLDIQSSSSQGRYQGTLTWSLANAPS
ncbi:WxL domain-containing protein [Levilactobacillus lanxiensis]|uniref:WxL domain-containing protein n=1 Tax=Levilactobacillus lanxiensis TaxID=2799568 RepID=A0ABW4CY64_9LACO|nr:WxL domain-containing protein [Levilactobacillus lanxiensis]